MKWFKRVKIQEFLVVLYCCCLYSHYRVNRAEWRGRYRVNQTEIFSLNIMVIKISLFIQNFCYRVLTKDNHWEKGGSKVQILGQGGAIERPPMDEMTWNFACRVVLWGTFDFWPSSGHTASMEDKPIFLISGTLWVSNMHTQHPGKLIIKIWPHMNHTYWVRSQ